MAGQGRTRQSTVAGPDTSFDAVPCRAVLRYAVLCCAFCCAFCCALCSAVLCAVCCVLCAVCCVQAVCRDGVWPRGAPHPRPLSYRLTLLLLLLATGGGSGGQQALKL